MNTSFNEKLIAYLALLSGLSVSSVAIFYSVSGLTAIFPAAIIPIIVMGVVLEIGKIVASLWLKQNWKVSHTMIKLYLSVAVAVLMLFTSIGIFGYLSKAHLDQNTSTGEIAAQVEIIDAKISTEKENIAAARANITQMDATIAQVMGRDNINSVTARKSQQAERASLQRIITQSQTRITALNAERAPIASGLRKVEAEVGPIKYIAAFFYNSSDPALLEKSVTWVIILIITVFDPLALILLIASQVSFQRISEKRLLMAETPVIQSIPEEIKIDPPSIPVEYATPVTVVPQDVPIESDTPLSLVPLEEPVENTVAEEEEDPPMSIDDVAATYITKSKRKPRVNKQVIPLKHYMSANTVINL